jgi:GNAT superfamily N-acetyltransferase
MAFQERNHQMKIVDFTQEHIEQAAQIAIQNYEDERKSVPTLPPFSVVPDLRSFAENGLGSAAFDGNQMLGFLCSYPPFKNAFGSTDAIGVFSPMGANGMIGENRQRVYAYLYQVAGEKWVKTGASSHAVCLYAHDIEAQEQFFRYGFGLRCIDAIRSMDEIEAPGIEGYTFYEPSMNELLEVHRLINELTKTYMDSPFFMFRELESEAHFLRMCEKYNTVFFVAKQEGQMVAFVCAELAGETFVKNTPGYLHTTGAYCLPKHRGKGITQKLLSKLVQRLREQGYSRLGVDFESINPSGSSFWLKYYTAYAHSVVRRIDEYAIFNRR